MPSIKSLLDGVLSIDPTAPALDFQGRRYSWGDLRRAIDGVRAELRAAGVAPGARVGVLARNRPPAFAAVLAVAAEGCIVTVNPFLPQDRLVADLHGLALPALLGEAADLEREGVADALKRTGSAAVVVDADLSSAHRLAGLEQTSAQNAAQPPSAMIIEMLTSGTTGPPKRIPLQRAAFETSFASAQSYESGRGTDDPPRLRSGTEILSGPITHIGGLWGVLNAVLNGRQCCLLEKFTVESWRDAIVRHRPKVVGAVPAALRMVLDAEVPAADLSSLRAIRTGAAPLDAATVESFLHRYDLPVLQAYGATEFSGAVAGWTLDAFRQHYQDKVGSVGRFQPGIQGRVVDMETGEVLPHGHDGLLEMKARQFGNGDAWLRTTDRARIDEDGFLFIRGRADNAIQRGGFKIHPEDITAVLEQHPAVQEAVIVGIKDERLGEVPVGAVVLKAKSAPADCQDLLAFAKERLLPYQVPMSLRILDTLPRTPSMKPALSEVRRLFDEGAAP